MGKNNYPTLQKSRHGIIYMIPSVRGNFCHGEVCLEAPPYLLTFGPNLLTLRASCGWRAKVPNLSTPSQSLPPHVKNMRRNCDVRRLRSKSLRFTRYRALRNLKHEGFSNTIRKMYCKNWIYLRPSTQKTKCFEGVMVKTWRKNLIFL